MEPNFTPVPTLHTSIEIEYIGLLLILRAHFVLLTREMVTSYREWMYKAILLPISKEISGHLFLLRRV